MPATFRVSDGQWEGPQPASNLPSSVWFLKLAVECGDLDSNVERVSIHTSPAECLAAASLAHADHFVVQQHVEKPALLLGAKVMLLALPLLLFFSAAGSSSAAICADASSSTASFSADSAV